MEKSNNVINLQENQIEKFVGEIRPPQEIRDKLDIGFSFEKNTLEIYEIRPSFINPEKKTNTPVVKTRFVKTKGFWSIYWMRASGKWETYKPYPQALDLSEFFEVLKEDVHGCFWG